MCTYLESQGAEGEAAKPFLAMLSWGTPHDPYNTAPGEYVALYPDGCTIKLRPNVPSEFSEEATRDLRGYYAHIAALDDCMAKLLSTLEKTGLASNTIVVFTSKLCCGFVYPYAGHVAALVYSIRGYWWRFLCPDERLCALGPCRRSR